jgi:hypothetical protein
MKRIGIASALLALGVLAALAIVTSTSKNGVRAVYAQSGCSDATLAGNYAFRISGFTSKNVANGNPLPVAVVGVLAFDGTGNFSTHYTDMSPGKPTYIALEGTGSGTYAVNSDCTGSISFTAGDAAGLDANMVIIGGGMEGFAAFTTPFVISVMDFKKQ